jgi:thiamine pyrophosphate-dependent acetolactate synthase large subunit-like protein
VSGEASWGSDLVAEFLRAVDVPFIAINPGASFRGLHDSLVNHLGDEQPQILLCLHEEQAVALAHGYAKVTGRPLAVALHANVGLMHASMAIYNAFVDRVPVFILGANGPMDAARRRPWIDWIHSSADQAAMVRNYVKWDDQPASVEATMESLARAWDLTRTPPYAPTYVVLDTSVQEERLDRPIALPRVDTPVDRPEVSPTALAQVAGWLTEASDPVILMGRTSRDTDEWERRVCLVEALGARVVTDLKAGAAFPTNHPACVPGQGFFLSSSGRDALAAADVVLALDWIDVQGTLAQAPATRRRTLVDVTQDHQLHNGWSKDHQARTVADLTLPVAPDVAVEQLLAVVTGAARSDTRNRSPRPDAQPAHSAPDGRLDLPFLARSLRAALHDLPVCLVRLPLGWDGDLWDFEHPLDYLGYDGGGGIGSGPGMTVGAALALRGTGRVPVAVLGDGDYLMGVQAFWTAAHERIPLLAVIANNRSYFNDEIHQEKVAAARGRDVSRRWVGQRIDDPAPDLAALARAEGLDGIGPVTDPAELDAALARAVDLVRGSRPVVVDVVVEPGYSPAMQSGLTRGE